MDGGKLAGPGCCLGGANIARACARQTRGAGERTGREGVGRGAGGWVAGHGCGCWGGGVGRVQMGRRWWGGGGSEDGMGLGRRVERAGRRMLSAMARERER